MPLHELEKQNEQPITQNPELDITLSDDELINLIDSKIGEYSKYLDTERITERAKKNVAYWKDNRHESEKAGEPQQTYANNIIHRDLATRAQNATSRMPDIVVMSPEQEDDPQIKEKTRSVEDWLGIRIDNDVTRRLAKGAIYDHHLKYRAIWKYRYDHFKKDVVIDRLKPEDVILDSTARIPEDGFTADNMEFIGEWITEATASVLAKFSDKREAILNELGREEIKSGKPRSSKMRYLECWAKVHNTKGEPKIILVHKYNHILLAKNTNPYWDDREKNLEEMGEIPPAELHPSVAQILPQLGLDVPEYQPKRFNHFPHSRMPYSIFSAENLGDGPIDDITVVEVGLPLQDTVNRRGNQITLTNDWAVPKTAIDTEAITAEQAEDISRDPSEVIKVTVPEGRTIQSTIYTWSGEQASPALYQDLQQAIQAIDSHFSTNPVTRGETVTQESGISKQISREGDLSSADDLAQTMVQRCVEEAANWLVQLAKIYFDKPVRAMKQGFDRSLKTAAISSQLIPDNIQIVVKANAIDKMTMRNLAMNLIGGEAIDPQTLYEILDFPNPKEMTQRLIDYLSGKETGYMQYRQDIGLEAGVPADQQSEADTQQGPQGQPGMPQAPQPPQIPQ